MIQIVEASSRSQMKQFVKFPFTLYRDTPQWIPPLIADELSSFDRQKNPVFRDAEAWFYLALRGEEVVGRIAVIANWAEIRQMGVSKIRFGWLDFIDDLEVSRVLIDQALHKGRELQLEYAEGPMGFSNLDKVGLLTEGFEYPGNMITWYNHAYYADHMLAHGLVQEKEYDEHTFPAANALPEMFMKASGLVKKRYGLRALSFTRSKDIMPHVDEMFDLFNRSYSRLSSFVAISDIQKAYMKKKYISFINPEFIKFVYKGDEMIAFAIVMPSFTEAMIKAKGHLFPFGWYFLWQAKRNVKDVIFYLIGIREDFQSKGVPAVIFEEYYYTFTRMGIRDCYRTPELTDNIAIHNLWKDFSPKKIKVRCTYRINL